MNEICIEGILVDGEPTTIEMLKKRLNDCPDDIVLVDIDRTTLYFETKNKNY